MQQLNKSAMRKTLLDNGIRTRGMTDIQIQNEYDTFMASRDSKPEAKPEAKPNGKKKPNGKTKPEAQPEAPEAKPEAQPEAPEAQPDTGLANVLEKAIQDAIGSYQPKAQFDEKQVIDLIEKYTKAPTRIEYEITVKRPDGKPEIKIPKAHPILKKILDVASLGENVFVSGPAACGKTTLGEQVAKALGFEFFFTGPISDEYKFAGFVDANGTYHETSFYKALKAVSRGAEGAVYLIDESDSSAADAMLVANAAFENGYFDFPHETVYFDKSKVFFLLTANTLGMGANRQYIGRSPLDGASLNRFERMTMEYDTGIEIGMAESAWLKAGGAEDDIRIARDWAHEVIAFRRQLDEKKILAIVTPRHTRRGAGLLALGWSVQECRKALYIDLSDDILKTLGVSRNGK